MKPLIMISGKLIMLENNIRIILYLKTKLHGTANFAGSL